MVKRKIIRIDEEKCNGCGLCIPNCPEGALQVIDGKARLISDLFCDGLGACIGHCPENAITTEEREAEPYDEKKVMENIVKAGKNTILAHLKHLKEHNETKYLNQAKEFLREKNIEIPMEEGKMEHPHSGGCPGAALREVNKDTDVSETYSLSNDQRTKSAFYSGKQYVSEHAQKPPYNGGADKNMPTSKRAVFDASGNSEQASALRQWPVQLNLLPPQAQFFENSHLLVSADCVPFANANFHSKLLNGKSLVIGCPKLDDIEAYQEKLTEIFKNNKIKSITVAIMEVPCCHGLLAAVEEAVEASGKKIPMIDETIGINGEIQ